MTDTREDESRFPGHRLQVRLQPIQLDGVRALAMRSGISLSHAVRVLIQAGLAEGLASDNQVLAAEQAALAALLAAEHTLKLLETWLPDGVRRAQEVRALAERGARERLAEVRQVEAGD